MPLNRHIPRFLRAKREFSPALLERLPVELILEILVSLDSFGDLNALICASPTCLQIFNRHTDHVLNSLAYGIVGMDGWEDSVVVLTCQRHRFPLANAGRLVHDLMSNFSFRREDIPHLSSNERAYEICAKQFCIAAAARPSFLDIPFGYQQGIGQNPPILISLRNTPGFPKDGVLPKRTFYRVWVYCVATKYENIGFPIDLMSAEQRIDLRLIQYLMRPKSVKKAINWELRTGYKGRAERSLVGRLSMIVKPEAEKIWGRICGMPMEILNNWDDFKEASVRTFWAFLDSL